MFILNTYRFTLPAPTITLTTGAGYAGSTYTVTNGGTGNWQSDGVNIPDATGPTLTITHALEGKRNRWMRSDGVASNPDELWVPMDYPNAVAWWDAAQTSSLTLTSSRVSAWVDRIGGLVASQATSSNQPTYLSSARNGQPGLRFDAAQTQHLKFDPATLPAGDLTVMAMGFLDLSPTSGDWRRIFGYGEAVDNNKGVHIIRQGSSKTASELTASPGTVDWAQNDRVVILSKLGTAGSLFVDGSDALKTGVFAAFLQKTIGYIGRGLQYADPWPGTAQQLFVAGSAGSKSDREKLQGWASWRNGLGGSNLPSSHPYKTSAPRIQ